MESWLRIPPELLESDISVESGPGPSRFRKLKRWAWRSTAAYLWLHFLVRRLLPHDYLGMAVAFLLTRLIHGLGELKFAPVNVNYLVLVVKVSWLLIITAFSPAHLIGFLFFYLLPYPVWLFVYIRRRHFRDSHKKKPAPKLSPGLITTRRRTLTVPILSMLVLGWLIIYGSATSQIEVLPGVLFTGFLFLALCYRMIQRARPLAVEEISFFKSLQETGATFLVNDIKKESSSRSMPTRHDLTATVFSANLAGKIYRNLALLIRGRQGRRRMAAFILLDYVLSLIAIGAVAVFFWALLIKVVLAPQMISTSVALEIMAAKFLPGLEDPATLYAIPTWCTVGAAATGWILFVLYIGPAASAMVQQQEAYGRALERPYKKLRLVSCYWRLRLKRAEKARKLMDENDRKSSAAAGT